MSSLFRVLGNEFNMLAVLMADFLAGTDDNVIRNDAAGNNGILADMRTRHDYTVDDFRAFIDNTVGSEHGILNIAHYNSALCDIAVFNFSFRTDILRKRIDIFCIDLPVRIGQIKLIVVIEQVHVSFPEGIQYPLK